MNLLRQVTLDKANRKKDKSVSITFITELEQSPEQYMEIDKALDQHGVLYFKPNGDLTQQEIDSLDKVEVSNEGKSKSQRLRNVLYIYWKQTNSKSTFDQFYSMEMEKIITHYKDKLE